MTKANTALRAIGLAAFHSERSVLIRAAIAAAERAAARRQWSHCYVEQALKRGENDGWATRVGLSFDCDLPEDVSSHAWLLERLREYGLRASFACIGKYVEMYPAEHRLLADAGHEIINHTYSHPSHRLLNPTQRFRVLSDKLLREEVSRAHEIIEKIIGVAPLGFRAPHFGGLHTNRVYPILREMGYRYSSSTIGTRTPTLGSPFKFHGIWEIPLSPDPKTALGCLETWGLYRASPPHYKDKNEFLALFDEILKIGMVSNAFLNFYFDPVDLHRDPEMCNAVLRRFARLADEGCTVGPYVDLLNCVEEIEPVPCGHPQAATRTAETSNGDLV